MTTPPDRFRWLPTGQVVLSAMLSAIDSARSSISLEIYIFSRDAIGEQFRAALVRAQTRGVRVRVLVDSMGALTLPDDFWQVLRRAGGEVRWFNPMTLQRFWFRDHRKLMVCDGRLAFVGGFNIADEYNGDGVQSGWCDLGLQTQGPLAKELESSFETMFARADSQHKHFMRLRRFDAKKSTPPAAAQLLLSGPGRGRNPISRALHADLASAREARIVVAYFLPTRQLRRDLERVARKGGRVQLILAGKTDVLLSQLAAQSLYRRLLNAGVEIYEYQPQILHAKLLLVDDAVYAGSSNLDRRSLWINYELMIRFQTPEITRQAREIFSEYLKQCRRIEPEAWSKSRTIWQRLKRRLAYFLLVRIDPYFARQQWRALPD